EVGRDADDVVIERGMMQLAECQAVGNHRLPAGMSVWQDVGGVQQLVVTKPADGAALAISAEYTLAKAALVQTLPNDRGDIPPPRGQSRRVVHLPDRWAADLIVDGHDEGEGLGMIIDDEDGPRRLVQARHDSVQIDERSLALHGEPQSHVVSVARIGAP